MPYTYTLTSILPATPQQIYDAWLDSLAHSEMTGSKADMSDEVGAEVSAWDGYITGANLELIRGERIVQSWRTSRFTDEHEDSIVTVTLEEADDGTLLTLVHSNVPDDQRNYEEGGWQSNYFEPMRVYFASLEQEAGEQRSERAPPKARARVKRAAGQKPQKPAPRAKPRAKAAKAKKLKRAAAKSKVRRTRAAAKKAPRAAPKRKAARRKRSRR